LPLIEPAPGGSPTRETADGVADKVQAGDPRALARAISWVENGDTRLRSVEKAFKPPKTGTRVIGPHRRTGGGQVHVTSALVGCSGEEPADRGSRGRSDLAVLGGALLGDRIRMQGHATDPGVFIRSMGSRGQLGGLAAAAPQAIRILQAAGTR